MPLRLTGWMFNTYSSSPCRSLTVRSGGMSQLLEWLIEAIHPDGRIAERFRTGRVPPAKRGEDDLFLL